MLNLFLFCFHHVFLSTLLSISFKPILSVYLFFFVCVFFCSGKMPFKVLVVGGGVSGLMAARQLSYFGLDVTIIEARVRPFH